MSSKLKEEIDDILYFHRLLPGRSSGGDVEFAAVDKEYELSEEKIRNEAFRNVHVSEDAFDYVEFMFSEVSEESSFSKYSLCYFDEEKIHILIDRLAKFDNQLGIHDTMDSFCSVWNAVNEKWAQEYIQRNYSDTWEYLRFAIRLVCIQLRQFFELCIEEKKTVLMIGI